MATNYTFHALDARAVSSSTEEVTWDVNTTTATVMRIVLYATDRENNIVSYARVHK